ncbi:MAG TPA: hypothetical protein DGH68_10530 [Bacteroidetes bacterium]|nr:hypothetical protein [Bacteroidota bacterium]
MNQSSSAVRNIASGRHHPTPSMEGKISKKLEKYRHQAPEKQGKSRKRKLDTDNTDWTNEHRLILR